MQARACYTVVVKAETSRMLDRILTWSPEAQEEAFAIHRVISQIVQQDWLACPFRRQPHAIGDTLVTARIVDAFTRLAVEQLAADIGEMNFARVLVLELDQAATPAAVA